MNSLFVPSVSTRVTTDIDISLKNEYSKLKKSFMFRDLYFDIGLYVT